MSGSEPARRYTLDATLRRYPSPDGAEVVVGGSPLTLFKLSPAGARVLDRLAAGQSVDASSLVDRLLDTGSIHPEPHGQAPYGRDDVTVVVPAFGAPQRRPAGSVVVDDGSVPPIPDATIRLDHNRGPAAARNAGLACVTTPLVAFVDADVDLPDDRLDWLDALLPHFADPRVAVVAPRVVTAPAVGPIAAYERDRGPLDMGPAAARVEAGTRVSYLPAAVLVCRTDAVREVGGFDESMRFGEDVDLIWRLGETGWRCRYEPAVVVQHEPRPDWRSWVRQRVGYGSSAGPLARRHPRRLAPVRMSAWSLLTWILAAAGRPVLAATVGVGSAAALVPKLPDVPGGDAFRLAATGNLRAGQQLTNAVRRVWFPVVAVLSVRSRLARRVLLASLVSVRSPLQIADDVAYCAGVWVGMSKARTLDPLVPAISSWPGHSRR